MQPARTKLGEQGALGALVGLIFGVGARFAGGAVGLAEILICGGVGLAVGVAVGMIMRRV